MGGFQQGVEWGEGGGLKLGLHAWAAAWKKAQKVGMGERNQGRVLAMISSMKCKRLVGSYHLMVAVNEVKKNLMGRCYLTQLKSGNGALSPAIAPSQSECRERLTTGSISHLAHKIKLLPFSAILTFLGEQTELISPQLEIHLWRILENTIYPLPSVTMVKRCGPV